MTDTLTPTNFAGLEVVKAGARPFSTNMLIFGDAGVGKTWLAGSADAVPDMRRVLHIDAESGVNTLKAAWPNVETIATTKWQDLIDIHAALYAGGHGYQTVIMDSLTEINDYNIDQVMVEARAKKGEAFDDVLEIFHWNKVASRMLRLIRQFRDLPMNTIFLAHMMEDVDKKTGKQKKVPLLTGQLKKKVPTIPDLVMYMWIDEDEESGELQRKLLTQTTPTCVAKARGIDNLPAVLVNANMRVIYDYIEASKKEVTS